MSRRLIMVLALAFVVGMAFTAYAEVQNVKVSGDINMMGIVRNDFNLTKGPTGDTKEDNEGNIISQIRVRIDADLTDNVMTTIRLINERNWDTESSTNSDIDVDLAYVTLKEFLYSPLSLTVGRQELRYGNGLIIANARNYSGVPSGVPTDLIERKAFDAIKAVLNYDPLMIDLVAARIDKVSVVDNRDKNLLGMNATYAIDKDTSVQAYLWNLQNRDKVGKNNKTDHLNTIGALVTSTAFDNLTASIEGAMQFGRYNAAGQATTEYRAYALQAKANYMIPCEKMKQYSPMVGAAYTYLSGDKDDEFQHQWQSMYYEKHMNNITHAILPFSAMSVLNLMASAKPMEDLAIMANWGIYHSNNKNVGQVVAPYANSDGTNYGTYTMTDKKFLGNALDVTATYAYTEDVSLGLTAGWFFPGKAFDKGTDDRGRRTASQVIGSMKVTF